MADLAAILSDHPIDGALRLLGATLTTHLPDGPVSVRLSEVEAYGGVGEDPGSHAFRGQTARNATMFGPPGHLYVYFTYGMHWCANIVTGPTGSASAVLLRAGEIVDGLAVARRRRPGASVRDLARGPARLTRALGIDGGFDGEPLDGGRLSLTLASDPPAFDATPRTGVAGPGGVRPWRFAIVGDRFVSPYRPARPR